jgi:hypothetical protein
MHLENLSSLREFLTGFGPGAPAQFLAGTEENT